MKKIILPLLLLSVLLTACQTAPADTHFTTAPSATAPATKPATQPTTEPTTTGQHSTSNTINNAKKITVGMTEADVFDILQLSGQTLFQNVSVQRWDLDNGKFLYVWFHPAETETLVGGFDICDSILSWPGDAEASAPNTQTNAAYADRIHAGMVQSELFTQFESEGTTVCINAELVQYPLKNGGYALIWYADIDGIKTVCKTEVQGGALA